MKRAISCIVSVFFTLAILVGCSSGNAALADWMHSLDEQQLVLYFWHNNIENRLTDDEVRKFVTITNSLTEDNFKVNKYLAGITPEYGLRMVIGDEEYHINQADAPNGETEINFQDKQWWIRSSDLHDYMLSLLNSFEDTQAGASAPVQIEMTAAQWSPEQIIDVFLTSLDYADDDIIIFHGDYGLFVYDLSARQLIRSVDLKPIDCQQVQGSNACEVAVSADGETVQMHPVESNDMYVYSVSDNTIIQTAYHPMESPFFTVPSEMVLTFDSIGGYSYRSVKFETGEYGYLYSSDWTLGSLTYIRGDMKYSVLNQDEG